MKKHIKALVITVVLALLLGGYVAYIELYDTDSSGSNNIVNKPRAFFTSVSRVEITAPELEIAFEKTGEKWAIVSPVSYPADRTKIENIVDELDLASPERTVEDINDKLIREHGLEDPRFTIALVGEDKSRVEVKIGNATAETSKLLYAMLADGDKIFVVRDNILQYLAKKIDEYRSTHTIDITASDTSRVQLSGLWNYEVKHKGDRWELTSPFTATAGKLDAESLCQTVYDLKAVSFVDDRPSDFSAYGLSEPAGVIISEPRTGSELRLLIGAETTYENAEGTKLPGRYARMEGRNTVFVLPAATIGKIPVNGLELVELKLCEVVYEGFKSFELKSPESNFTIVMEDNELVFKDRDGKKSDGDAMKELVDLLSSITATEVHPLEELGDKAGLNGARVLELNPGTTAADSWIKLEIGAFDEAAGGWYARRNNESVVLVLPSDKFKRVAGLSEVDLLDRQIARFEADDVYYVSIKQEGKSVSFTKVDGKWRCDTNPLRSVEDQKLSDALGKLEMFQSLKIVPFVESSEELGSADPRAKIVISALSAQADENGEKKKTTVTIFFGKDFEEGDKKGVFAWVEGDPFAFAAPNSIYSLLAENYLSGEEDPKPAATATPGEPVQP